MWSYRFVVRVIAIVAERLNIMRDRICQVQLRHPWKSPSHMLFIGSYVVAMTPTWAKRTNMFHNEHPNTFRNGCRKMFNLFCFSVIELSRERDYLVRWIWWTADHRTLQHVSQQCSWIGSDCYEISKIRFPGYTQWEIANSFFLKPKWFSLNLR